jgi:hypothetical protein
MSKGDNFTPRRQSSPLKANFTLRGEIKNKLLPTAKKCKSFYSWTFIRARNIVLAVWFDRCIILHNTGSKITWSQSYDF